jgi:hypothetical protein
MRGPASEPQKSARATRPCTNHRGFDETMGAGARNRESFRSSPTARPRPCAGAGIAPWFRFVSDLAWSVSELTYRQNPDARRIVEGFRSGAGKLCSSTRKRVNGGERVGARVGTTFDKFVRAWRCYYALTSHIGGPSLGTPRLCCVDRKATHHAANAACGATVVLAACGRSELRCRSQR